MLLGSYCTIAVKLDQPLSNPHKTRSAGMEVPLDTKSLSKGNIDRCGAAQVPARGSLHGRFEKRSFSWIKSQRERAGRSISHYMLAT